MCSKKWIWGEKKIPNYRQSVVQEVRLETPLSEPQRNQPEARTVHSGNKYDDSILEVPRRGCQITTDAPLRVGDVIKFKSPAALRGRVVWGQRGSFGLEFID